MLLEGRVFGFMGLEPDRAEGRGHLVFPPRCTSALYSTRATRAAAPNTLVACCRERRPKL
jgi:hypothetical protein